MGRCAGQEGSKEHLLLGRKLFAWEKTEYPILDLTKKDPKFIYPMSDIPLPQDCAAPQSPAGSSVKYFAYGSNMCSGRLSERVSCTFVAVARLAGHQLRFHKVSKDGSSKCDAFHTAGRGQDNIAYEAIERARKVARGEIIDPSVLPVLFETEADCDYTSEDVWRHVNPGSRHGYPSIDGFRRQVRRAQSPLTTTGSMLGLSWVTK